MPRAAVSLHSFHSPIPFWYTNNNFLISFLINFSPLNQHYVRTDIVDCTIVNVSTSMISLEFLFFFFSDLKQWDFFYVQSGKLFVLVLLLFTRHLECHTYKQMDFFVWPWASLMYSIKCYELVYNSVIIRRLNPKKAAR